MFELDGIGRGRTKSEFKILFVTKRTEKLLKEMRNHEEDLVLKE